MSMQTAHEVDEERHSHPSDAQYIGIAAILAAITALEVSVYYINFFKDSFIATVAALIPMMIVKFALVVAFFMHLRFDNKIFRAVFLAGLILAVIVYMVVLFTFHVFAH